MVLFSNSCTYIFTIAHHIFFPNEERFYPFETLAFKTLKLWLFSNLVNFIDFMPKIFQVSYFLKANKLKVTGDSFAIL